MGAFTRKAEDRGLLTVPIYEFTAYEFKDRLNRDYASDDDRYWLDSSY